MKPTHLLITSALGFAVLSSSPAAFSQAGSKRPSAEPERTETSPEAKRATETDAAAPKTFATEPARQGGFPGRGSKPSERIETLMIPAHTPLEAAVELVQRHLPKDRERSNIVFSGNVETQMVPALTLRNVTGPDALMLIATAANVQIQPIRGLEGNMIGFQFSARPKQLSMAGSIQQNPFEALPPPVYADATPALPAAATDDLGSAGLPPQIQAYGDRHPVTVTARAELSAITTRIYPLAEITTSINEIENTLREVLTEGGASADAAKLSFHKKTGVLVVRAPQDAQRLVQELLQALAQNNKGAREINATRELARVEVKVDSLERELEHERMRLQKRADEAEALARNYQRELLQLQESQQNKK